MAQKGVPMNNQRLGETIWAKTPRVVSNLLYHFFCWVSFKILISCYSYVRMRNY